VLGIRLKDDIISSFSDGVILCQLVNRLFPGTISSVMDGEVYFHTLFVGNCLLIKSFKLFSP